MVGVDDGYDSPSGEREQARTAEGTEQPEALPYRAEHSPGVTEQFVGEHQLQERRLAGAEERVIEPISEGDQVDEPELSPSVYEEEQQYHGGASEIAPDQERSARQAVDHETHDRGEEGGGGDREEDESGVAVAACEHLDPDAQGEEHRRVAEERERLSD